METTNEVSKIKVRELIPGLLWSTLIDGREYLIDKTMKLNPTFSYRTYVDPNGHHHSSISARPAGKYEYNWQEDDYLVSCEFDDDFNAYIKSSKEGYPEGALIVRGSSKFYSVPRFANPSDKILYDKLNEWGENSEYIKQESFEPYKGDNGPADGVVVFKKVPYSRTSELDSDDLVWSPSENRFYFIQQESDPDHKYTWTWNMLCELPKYHIELYQAIFKKIASIDPVWATNNKEFLSNVLDTKNDKDKITNEIVENFILKNTPAIESLMTQEISVNNMSQLNTLNQLKDFFDKFDRHQYFGLKIDSNTSWFPVEVKSIRDNTIVDIENPEQWEIIIGPGMRLGYYYPKTQQFSDVLTIILKGPWSDEAKALKDTLSVKDIEKIYYNIEHLDPQEKYRYLHYITSCNHCPKNILIDVYNKYVNKGGSDSKELITAILPKLPLNTIDFTKLSTDYLMSYLDNRECSKEIREAIKNKKIETRSDFILYCKLNDLEKAGYYDGAVLIREYKPIPNENKLLALYLDSWKAGDASMMDNAELFYDMHYHRFWKNEDGTFTAEYYYNDDPRGKVCYDNLSSERLANYLVIKPRNYDHRSWLEKNPDGFNEFAHNHVESVLNSCPLFKYGPYKVLKMKQLDGENRHIISSILCENGSGRQEKLEIKHGCIYTPLGCVDLFSGKVFPELADNKKTILKVEPFGEKASNTLVQSALDTLDSTSKKGRALIGDVSESGDFKYIVTVDGESMERKGRLEGDTVLLYPSNSDEPVISIKDGVVTNLTEKEQAKGIKR